MIYSIPTVALIGGLLLSIVVAVEGGILIGNRYGERTWSNAHDIHTALTAATLGLLGLMLAFTFDMSGNRFNERRAMIVTESNAIQSVRTNLDFLAPQPRAQALELLHSYAGKRIAFLLVGNNAERERQAVTQAHSIFAELWRIAIDPQNYSPLDREVLDVQFNGLTEALLNLDSVAREREAARDRRVPEPVLILLLALAIGAAAVLGYMSGAAGHPDRIPTYAVMLLVCIVIYLIVDFDRPRRGLLKLDATPLEKVLN